MTLRSPSCIQKTNELNRLKGIDKKHAVAAKRISVWKGPKRSFAIFKIGRQEIEAIIERTQFIRNQKILIKAEKNQKGTFAFQNLWHRGDFLTDALRKHLCSSSDTSCMR
jgi:hypothetical protein